MQNLYTHSLVARTVFCCTVCLRILRTSSCVSHTGWLKVLKRCLSRECHTSPSRLLASHVSPISLFLARSLRDHSRLRLHRRSHPLDLAVYSRPLSAGHAPLRTCIATFGYLAKPGANTGYEPKEFDMTTSVD